MSKGEIALMILAVIVGVYIRAWAYEGIYGKRDTYRRKRKRK